MHTLVVRSLGYSDHSITETLFFAGLFSLFGRSDLSRTFQTMSRRETNEEIPYGYEADKRGVFIRWDFLYDKFHHTVLNQDVSTEFPNKKPKDQYQDVLRVLARSELWRVTAITNQQNLLSNLDMVQSIIRGRQADIDRNVNKDARIREQHVVILDLWKALERTLMAKLIVDA